MCNGFTPCACGFLSPQLTFQGVSQKGFAMCGRERLRVHVLGGFRLLTGDIPISIPSRSRKPRELLQALVAFGGTEVNAGVLIDALWPDSEGDAAYHALESALYGLRQLLGARDAVRMEGGNERERLGRGDAASIEKRRFACGPRMSRGVRMKKGARDASRSNP
jgi:DNA-binding SARP family transcriptional activator